MGDFDFDDVIRTAKVIVNPEQAAASIQTLTTEIGKLAANYEVLRKERDQLKADNQVMFAAVASVWADHEHKGYTTKSSIDLCGKAIQAWLDSNSSPEEKKP
jgi:hypothetical protein